MFSVGDLIWIACRPLIRLVACVACGIIVTKTDIFPLVATKSASQIIVNFSYPCLLFSKIVPASFTADSLRAFGPLVVVALMYQLIGALLGLIVKQLFWVPHRFRYGIIFAGAFGNVGDLPTAVALAVTTSPPFNGVSDQNLSVAYISVFILALVITVFPMGMYKLLMWDFAGPDVEPEEVMAAMRRKRRMMFTRLGLSKGISIVEVKDPESRMNDVELKDKETEQERPIYVKASNRKQTSFIDDGIAATPVEGQPTESEGGCLCGPRSLERTGTNDNKSSVDLEASEAGSSLPSTPHMPPKSHRLLKSVKEILKSFVHPISIAIFVSFPITLVPKLKALFVNVPGTYMPTTPDGQPPLAVVMDVTSFIGGSAIPLALICLGSSIARLHVPKRKEWGKLPLGAIGSLAAGKLLVMPVIGVLICEGLTKAGFISRDDKVLRFVCIFCSCLPTATSQVFLTQIYSGTGSAEDISVFLIPQYFLMFFTMTTITAYTLHLLS